MSVPLERAPSFNPAYDPKRLEQEAREFQQDVYAQTVDLYDFLGDTFGDFRPKLAAVLGSGMGGVVNDPSFKEIGQLPYADIPHMATPQTSGHAGMLHWGTIEDLPVMLFGGRVQTTDFLQWNITSSRAARLATLPLTVAKGLGVENFVLTSATGLLEKELSLTERLIGRQDRVNVGDVIAIANYTNFMPEVNPAFAYIPQFGDRFIGKSHILDQDLYQGLAQGLRSRLHIGSYSLSPSTPRYEGSGDVARMQPRGIRRKQNGLMVAGMTLNPEIETLLDHYDPARDPFGFDKKVSILALAMVTNIIPPPDAPTRRSLHHDANPTSHTEVKQAGAAGETYLIPAFAQLCKQLSK